MATRPILKALLTSTVLVMAWCVVKPAMAQAVSAPPADMIACDAAGDAAEARYALPPGMLRAIGRVESGRRDPATGQVAPWPWAINAEGRGQLLASRDEALATTRALQHAGVASIDVGCFQVNLVQHPQAFPVLEDGFDPVRNADYAARFLVSLRARTGNWDAAVAAYHSATPELGQPYRDHVLAVWGRPPSTAVTTAVTTAMAPPSSPATPAQPAPLTVRVVTWAPPRPGAPSSGMRVWTPSAAGQGAAVSRITRG